MSKLLTYHAFGLPEIKNQQRRKFGESCRVYAYVKQTKKAKINDEKGGDKPKKQNS